MHTNSYNIVVCDYCGYGIHPADVCLLPTEKQAPKWSLERRQLCPPCYNAAIKRLAQFYDKLMSPNDEFEEWIAE